MKVTTSTQTGSDEPPRAVLVTDAWLSFKVKATELGKTLYQVKADLLRDYLCAELRQPRIPAFQPA